MWTVWLLFELFKWALSYWLVWQQYHSDYYLKYCAAQASTILNFHIQTGYGYVQSQCVGFHIQVDVNRTSIYFICKICKAMCDIWKKRMHIKCTARICSEISYKQQQQWCLCAWICVCVCECKLMPTSLGKRELLKLASLRWECNRMIPDYCPFYSHFSIYILSNIFGAVRTERRWLTGRGEDGSRPLSGVDALC